MIIEKKEGLKEGRGSLLERIRSQNAVPGMEFFSLRNQEERKKVLILSSWKAEREAKLVVRKLAVWTGKNMIRLFIVAGLEAGEM